MHLVNVKNRRIFKNDSAGKFQLGSFTKKNAFRYEIENMHLVNVKNRRIFKNDSAGDRTQNLWFRRPAPYPLGHRVFVVK